MSTDRELLELAAKAAGLTIECDADKAVVFPSHYSGGFSVLNDRGGSSLWNPLTDDGDALRLAVALKIAVDFDGVEQGCAQAMPNDSGHWEVEPCAEETRSSATRRAIVRAAAELGKQK